MLIQLWVSCCNVYMELPLLIRQEICSKINQNEDVTILKCRTICKLIKNRSPELYGKLEIRVALVKQGMRGRNSLLPINIKMGRTLIAHGIIYHWEWDWIIFTNVWKFTKAQFAKNKTFSITWGYPFSDNIRHLLLKAHFEFFIFQMKHIQLLYSIKWSKRWNMTSKWRRDRNSYVGKKIRWLYPF